MSGNKGFLFYHLHCPVLILGDLNGANHQSGSSSYNLRKTTVAIFIDNINLCLLNDSTPTFRYCNKGSYLNLDIFLTFPSIRLHHNWQVLKYIYSSEPFFPLYSPLSLPVRRLKISLFRNSTKQTGHVSIPFVSHIFPNFKLTITRWKCSRQHLQIVHPIMAYAKNIGPMTSVKKWSHSAKKYLCRFQHAPTLYTRVCKRAGGQADRQTGKPYTSTRVNVND